MVLALVTNIVTGQTSDDQSDIERRNAVRVYLDCVNCDMNYIREQIPYVNYVRDVREAQVYIMETRQNSGSGGNQYTYKFIGQDNYKGMNDTIIISTSPDLTTTLVREKRTDMLKLGLVRYVAKTPFVNEIKVNHSTSIQAEEVVDNWNNWVFEISTNPRFNSEALFKSFNLFNSINVSRVTPDMKLEIDLNQNSTNQKYIYEDDDSDSTTVLKYYRKDLSFRGLYVKSIGEHWSLGVNMNVRSATVPNYDLNAQFMPAIEYDLFPYSESTHRQLRFLYSAGVQYSDYIDTTIYNKTEETLFKHELSIAYQIQEKWGSINISLSGSNYLHDPSLNRLNLDGFVRLRILKGLSLSVNGGVAYIHDQLNLAQGNLTEAERLLRLKQQATSYDIQCGIGLTYTFGSIYNNVVNPRFGNGRGGGRY